MDKAMHWSSGILIIDPHLTDQIPGEIVQSIYHEKDGVDTLALKVRRKTDSLESVIILTNDKEVCMFEEIPQEGRNGMAPCVREIYDDFGVQRSVELAGRDVLGFYYGEMLVTIKKI